LSTAETGATAPVKTNHPIGFWFIFWGEFAERCCFYGARAILAKYMADKMGFGQDKAIAIYSYYLAACYFLPLLGGYIADKFLGKYNTIVLFSLPYLAGQYLLTVENQTALFASLALLAMGSGVIKPNISTLMGLTYNQFRPGQTALLSSAFGMFYMAINIGSTLSMNVVPWLKDEYGYRIAFAFPGVFMLMALILFAMGKKHYATEQIKTVAVPLTREERQERWRILTQLSGLFFMVIFFWAIFDQSSSVWIFFAQDFMDNTMFGSAVNPERLQAINPALIIGGIPLMTFMWTRLGKAGYKVTLPQKMIIGFFLLLVTMAIMTYAAYLAGPSATQVSFDENRQEIVKRVRIPEDRVVSIWWMVAGFVTLTLAEILISVSGLELAFNVAPQSMKGFITGLWLSVVGIANLCINAPVGELRLYTKTEPMVFFGALAAISLLVFVIFLFIARRFDRIMKEQEALKAKA
jgi:dipeptide/tripeptide permease